MIKPKIENLNINTIKESLVDSPNEVAVNLILTGSTAKKLLLLREIMITAFPDLTEEMIYKYLLSSGINKELEKFSNDD